jgi:predicted sugar kinase
MIVETVVTTLDEDGQANFAAMGVVWGEDRLVIRPYAGTRTFRNLVRAREAVVNVTDDVLLFAKSALSRERFPSRPATRVRGVILADACHWREVAVEEVVPPEPAVSAGGRADVSTRVVAAGVGRPFAGLCRAKHAVVEASILASRVRRLPRAEILAELGRLDPLVDKTGGPAEREAMAYIRAHVARAGATARRMRAIVETGARLHLGFLDLNGESGRRYGSIGVTLEHPRCVVEAGPAALGTPPLEPEVAAILARLDLGRGPGAIAVRVAEAIPPHAGFGSGTQLALSVALAASRAAGRSASIRELAQELGRGRRSGIGIAAFERGGLVIDAGHRVDDADPAGIDAEEPPPVIFQHPLPDDWHFVLATPRAAPGLSGTAERQAFRDLPPMAGERVGRICRLALIQVAPAALTGDIRTFGAAVTEIQAIVGGTSPRIRAAASRPRRAAR